MNYKDFKEKINKEIKEYKHELDLKLQKYKEKLNLKLEKFKSKSNVKNKNKRKIKGGVRPTPEVAVKLSIYILSEFLLEYLSELNAWCNGINQQLSLDNSINPYTALNLLKTYLFDFRKTYIYTINPFFDEYKRIYGDIKELQYRVYYINDYNINDFAFVVYNECLRLFSLNRRFINFRTVITPEIIKIYLDTLLNDTEITLFIARISKEQEISQSLYTYYALFCIAFFNYQLLDHIGKLTAEYGSPRTDVSGYHKNPNKIDREYILFADSILKGYDEEKASLVSELNTYFSDDNSRGNIEFLSEFLSKYIATSSDDEITTPLNIVINSYTGDKNDFIRRCIDKLKSKYVPPPRPPLPTTDIIQEQNVLDLIQKLRDMKDNPPKFDSTSLSLDGCTVLYDDSFNDLLDSQTLQHFLASNTEYPINRVIKLSTSSAGVYHCYDIQILLRNIHFHLSNSMPKLNIKNPQTNLNMSLEETMHIFENGYKYHFDYMLDNEYYILLALLSLPKEELVKLYHLTVANNEYETLVRIFKSFNFEYDTSLKKWTQKGNNIDKKLNIYV